MSSNFTHFSDSVYQYLLNTMVQETSLLKELREKTQTMPHSQMQISPEHGRFINWLLRLMGAKKILEIGVFTGYSTLWAALALPADGKIIACDIDPTHTAIASKFWTRAKVEDKIELRIGPALETMESLASEHAKADFDFIFIDADKKNYPHYYEKGLELLRLGGIIMIDNVLWDGKVADNEIEDESTLAIRALNKKIASDPRVSQVLLPMADGIILTQKIKPIL